MLPSSDLCLGKARLPVCVLVVCPRQAASQPYSTQDRIRDIRVSQLREKIAPDPVAEAMKRVSAIYDKMKNTLEDSAYADVSLSNGTNMQKFPRTSWDENYRKWKS